MPSWCSALRSGCGRPELAGESGDDQQLGDMLTNCRSIPVAGMEALIPALVDGRCNCFTQVVPTGPRY